MQNSLGQSPILLKYLGLYQENPKSRVFAPLAETYRKIGMADKAMSILKEGIRNHPQYLLGHLGLSACYADRGEFQIAYQTLRPFVKDHRENIRLQKLFSTVCIETNRLEEALETLKFLLFVNPRDQESSKKVKELEERLHVGLIDEKQEEQLRSFEEGEFFEVEKLTSIKQEENDPDWSLQDFSHETGVEEVGSIGLESHELPNFQEDKPESKKNEGPVFTQTLVDLYLKQGHKNKAIEILQKLVDLNPTDEVSQKKLSELTFDKKASAKEDSLMDLYDKKIGKVSNYQNRVQDTLLKFCDAIKARGSEYKASSI